MEIDREAEVVNGHMVLLTTQKLGWTSTVPVERESKKVCVCKDVWSKRFVTDVRSKTLVRVHDFHVPQILYVFRLEV